MDTDFIDDDLLRMEGSRQQDTEDRDGVPVTAIGEVGLGRMARQKGELTQQVAGASQEIETLRMRQETLEKEREALEELGKRQENYERRKEDILQRLGRSIVLLEKEEAQATRMAELVGETRSRFTDLLAEIRGINEETWADEDFQLELHKARTLVDGARKTYEQAIARIDAASWHKAGSLKRPASPVEEMSREAGLTKSFGYWLKVGMAMSLPALFVLVLLFVAWLLLTGMF